MPTKYGFYWLHRFAKFARSHNHKVSFIKRPTLFSLYKAIKNTDPKLVIFNGHGGSKGVRLDSHVLLGVKSYDRELGMKLYAENPRWMKGRLVYLATCNTGKELAFRLVDHGATAVAAFKEAFIFLAENENSPSRDHLAKAFFLALLQLPLHLARGKNFAYGSYATKKAFAHYRDVAEQKGDSESAKYLNHDLVNFIMVGDLGATL